MTCSASVDFRESNMRIKIKRADQDNAVEDARPYIKKIIILVNKQRLPMLFYAIDINKFPKSNFWHVIYKLKRDEYCPYVTLRIFGKRAEFAKSAFTI